MPCHYLNSNMQQWQMYVLLNNTKSLYFFPIASFWLNPSVRFFNKNCIYWQLLEPEHKFMCNELWWASLAVLQYYNTILKGQYWYCIGVLANMCNTGDYAILSNTEIYVCNTKESLIMHNIVFSYCIEYLLRYCIQISQYCLVLHNLQYCTFLLKHQYNTNTDPSVLYYNTILQDLPIID